MKKKDKHTISFIDQVMVHKTLFLFKSKYRKQKYTSENKQYRLPEEEEEREKQTRRKRKKKCNKNGFPLENAKTLRRRCWARFVIIYTPSIQNDMCNRVQRWDWKKFPFQLQSDTVWKYFLFVCEVIKKKKRKNGWWMEGRAQKINICFCKRQKKSYSTLCLFLLLFVDGSFAHFCR